MVNFFQEFSSCFSVLCKIFQLIGKEVQAIIKPCNGVNWHSNIFTNDETKVNLTLTPQVFGNISRTTTGLFSITYSMKFFQDKPTQRYLVNEKARVNSGQIFARNLKNKEVGTLKYSRDPKGVRAVDMTPYSIGLFLC